MFPTLADTAIDTVTIWEVGQEYSNAFMRTLPTMVLAVVVLFVFYFLSKVGKRSAETIAEKVFHDSSLQNLAGTFVGVLLIVIGVFAAATIVFPGLRAGDLVAVLGLSGVAIGFAFQDIFQNFLAGILLLWQRPFVVGDQIEVDEYAGTIEHIDIRATSLRSYHGQIIVIPNSDIYSSAVTVNTAEDVRRSAFETGIAYDEDIETGRKVITEAVNSCELVNNEPAPKVMVTGHGDSSIDFRLTYWTKSDRSTETAARDQVATAVKYALDDAGIEIPYPYRTVEFFDMTERNGAANQGFASNQAPNAPVDKGV